MTNLLPVGTRVQISNDPSISIGLNSRGKIATISAVDERTDYPWANAPYTLHFDGEDSPRPGHWTHSALVPLDEPEGPSRPTVDFSGDSRLTARQYAAAAWSRVLPADAQATLKAASNGEEVDAYALNAALTQAMSSAATRCGQSMARRDLTRKIRHLSYIVQAILENHADHLPVYESGERSRKVEEMKLHLDAARDEIDRERDKVNQIAEERDLKEAQRAMAVEVADGFQRRAVEAEEEVRRLLAVLDYTRAECVANEEARQRSFGFDDGTRYDR